MCFNSEVSMLLFVMGTLTSFKCLYKAYQTSSLVRYRSIQLGTFVFIVCIMQLWEYLLWENQECNKTNEVVSYLVMATVFLQPLIYFVVSWYLGLLKYYKNILYFLCLAFFIMGIVYLSYIYPQYTLCSIKDEKSCRLEWDGYTKGYEYSKPLFVIGLLLYLAIFIIIGFSRKTRKYKLIDTLDHYSIAIALLVAIIYSAIVNRAEMISIYGSFWCFLAAILIILI